jgi:putative transposase
MEGTMTAPWTDARTPALAIVARGDQIETLSASEFRVQSQSRPGNSYTVRVVRGKWSCDCPFYAETKVACIHVLSVRFRAGFKAPKEPETATPCPRCASGDVEGAGVRQNKSGPVRRFKCHACGANYSGHEGFHNRRSDPEIIAKALDLYFRGTSLRQVADHFAQAYGLKVSDTTIYRWVAYYSRIAAEWMDAQGAKVGTQWHVDERVVNVNGENHYLWNIMDADTRFLLASRISKGRGIPEARAAFKAAKRATVVEPTEIRSDGYPGYPEAIKREFGRYRRAGDAPKRYGAGCPSMWTPHRVVPSIRAPESNNILERLNGTQKDRTKGMRAYDNDRGASALSLGWQVHYNLVRPHLTLGKTPGEAAGIAPIGGFRWRTILELAAQAHRTEAPDWRTPEPVE